MRGSGQLVPPHLLELLGHLGERHRRPHLCCRRGRLQPLELLEGGQQLTPTIGAGSKLRTVGHGDPRERVHDGGDVRRAEVSH